MVDLFFPPMCSSLPVIVSHNCMCQWKNTDQIQFLLNSFCRGGELICRCFATKEVVSHAFIRTHTQTQFQEANLHTIYTRELVNIPRLFLQNEMGLHEELDAQPQSTGRHIVHLLADAVPQIQPQVLSFAAGKLQPKVVHFNYAQLSANLQSNERYESQ